MRGSIKRLGDRRWRLVFDVPSEEKRKQKVLIFYGTKRDAERELHKLVDAVRGGYRGTADTVERFLNGWISARTCAPGTRQLFATQMSYLPESFLRSPLDAITPLGVQRLYASLLTTGRKRDGKGLAPSTLQTLHTFLNTAFKDAERMGLVTSNPISRVRRPSVRAKNPRVLSPTEVRELLQVLAGTRWWLITWLAVLTGMRLGELLALERADFRLAECCIVVSRSKSRDGTIGPPKNGHVRTVPFPPDLIPVLEEHLPVEGPLFPDFKPSTVPGCFRALVQRLGFPGVHFHTLRHTVASMLFPLGVHPKAIQQLLGHHSVAYTMEVYSHLMPGAFEDTGRHLSSIIRDRSVTKGTVEKENPQ